MLNKIVIETIPFTWFKNIQQQGQFCPYYMAQQKQIENILIEKIR